MLREENWRFGPKPPTTAKEYAKLPTIFLNDGVDKLGVQVIDLLFTVYAQIRSAINTFTAYWEEVCAARKWREPITTENDPDEGLY